MISSTVSSESMPRSVNLLYGFTSVISQPVRSEMIFAIVSKYIINASKIFSSSSLLPVVDYYTYHPFQQINRGVPDAFHFFKQFVKITVLSKFEDSFTKKHKAKPPIP